MTDDLIRRSDALNPYLEFSLPRGARRFVTETLNAFLDYVKSVPSVDAVEVIRCKDCKFYHEDDYGYCEFWGDVFHHWEGYDKVDPNGFCYMGERKKDG